MAHYQLIQGDALERLKEMASESVHCVVTSPPYWGLRDYGTAQWEGGSVECDHQISAVRASDKSTLNGGRGVRPNEKIKNDGVPFRGDCGKCGARRLDQQLGVETTPEEYVTRLVEIFRDVRRVLRKDGTCWINLGDSYASSPPGTNGVGKTSGLHGAQGDTKYRKTLEQSVGAKRSTIAPGLKPKDLVGIPWMTAFALRADGWYLRSDIIWAKPNPMPESVTDRPTKAHEYLFLLSKSPRYYFDAESIKERSLTFDVSVRDRANAKINNTPGQSPHGGLLTNGYASRNARSVWTIATQPFSGAHFATFPKALVDRCIRAGTSEEGVCAECGAPYERDLEVKLMVIDRSERTHEPGRTRSSGTMVEPRTSRTVGWKASCTHNAKTIPATVLDPFSGVATTGVVANNLGRDYIGIELNPEYIRMAEERLYQPQSSLFELAEER